MPGVEVCGDEVHGLVGLKVGIGRGVDERWKRMKRNQSRCWLRKSASTI